MSRILFVTSRLPWPPSEGHQLRSWNLLRAAARRHEVELLSLRRPEDGDGSAAPLTECVTAVQTVPLPALSDPLRDPVGAARLLWRASRQRQPLLVSRYVSPALQQVFAERVRHADLVHFDMLPLAGLAPAVPSGVPVVLNEHNVESRLLASQAAIEASSWKRIVKRQQVGPLARFERAACERADLVLACSQPDAEQLQALAPSASIDVVPNGVDLDFFRGPVPHEEDDRTLVFVGGMGWLPNRDGVEFFLADILPRIRRTHAARLTVVGRSDGLAVPAPLREAVRLAGFVEDLRPVVREAAVYVVPLRAGSGTRLKILEAMAMGKAIVSTRIGAEGIALRHGEHALLADTPAEFSAAVCRLLDDRALREQLGTAARALAEREYGWDAIGERLLDGYAELLPARTRAARAAA